MTPGCDDGDASTIDVFDPVGGCAHLSCDDGDPSTIDMTSGANCLNVPDPTYDGDADGIPRDLDCNDADPTVFPGANETLNGIDDDCNALVDDIVDGDETPATATFVGNAPSIAAVFVPPLDVDCYRISGSPTVVMVSVGVTAEVYDSTEALVATPPAGVTAIMGLPVDPIVCARPAALVGSTPVSYSMLVFF